MSSILRVILGYSWCFVLELFLNLKTYKVKSKVNIVKTDNQSNRLTLHYLLCLLMCNCSGWEQRSLFEYAHKEKVLLVSPFNLSVFFLSNFNIYAIYFVSPVEL